MQQLSSSDKSLSGERQVLLGQRLVRLPERGAADQADAFNENTLIVRHKSYDNMTLCLNYTETLAQG